MRIGIGSMVTKCSPFYAEHGAQRRGLDMGLVIIEVGLALGRPVWLVLWPDGAIEEEYDRDLDLVQEGRV